MAHSRPLLRTLFFKDRILVAVLLLVSITALPYTLILFWADFHVTPVAKEMHYYAKRTGSIPTIEEYQRFKNTLDASLEITADNPQYKELKARLLLLALPHAVNKNKHLNDMLELHRQASFERPFWGVSSANLVFIKSKLLQYDDEYSGALLNAIKRAPWEPYVIQKVVASGITLWPYLSNKEKNLIAETAKRGLKLNALNLAVTIRRTIIKDRQATEFICNKITFKNRNIRKRWCESTKP